MKRVVLARVAGDTTLPAALEKIRTDTRAVVVDGPHGRLLLTAGDIMEAYNKAVDAGEDPATIPVSRVVPPHGPIHEAPARGLVADIGRLAGTMLTPAEDAHFRDVFHQNDHRYAIQHVGADSIAIVTASELYADALSMRATICRCKGMPVHMFERRQLRDPAKCNMLHGVAVTCKDAP